MNKIIALDPKARTIKVEGGVTFTQINEALRKEGSMCQSNLASISDITVAGAIATGTHGTGLKKNIIASMIKEMKVMDS
jgi:FAD/FMN-containing dehydrogenase